MSTEEESERLLQKLRGGLDTPGPALALSDHQTDALVAEILRRRRAATPPRKAYWRWGTIALLAGLPAAAAVVYGAASGTFRSSSAGGQAVRLASTEPPASAAASAPHDGAGLGVGVAPAPAERAPSPTRGVDSTSVALGHVPTARSESAAKPSHSGHDSPLEAPPADLLSTANRLRSKGDWQGAEAAYLEVTRLQPGTVSAYVAMASVGALRLPRDPRSALRIYERARAQSPAGPLDADIRWGMASAHRALGDARSEQRELEALLRIHPTASTAERARARLAALAQSK